MPSVTVQGIVLRTADYHDRDRMLTLLCPGLGRVEALSRGCRRAKSPLMAASEPFAYGEFIFYQSGDRYTLTACAIEDSFYDLRLDHPRLSCGAYMLALCNAVVQLGEPEDDLYRLLLKSLYQLCYVQPDQPRAVTAAFLLLFSMAMGYRPRMNHCIRCRNALDTHSGALLDTRAGGLCCEACAPRDAFRLSAAQVAWMRQVMRDGYAAGQSDSDAESMLPCLRRYVEERIETPIKAGRFL